MGQNPRCVDTKCQGNRSIGSAEKNFSGVYHIWVYGHVTQSPRTNFRSCMLQMKLGYNWPSGFKGEDVWKWLMDDGRPLAYHPISSPEAFGPGELKQLICSECTVWSKGVDTKRVFWGVVGCFGMFGRTTLLVSQIGGKVNLGHMKRSYWHTSQFHVKSGVFHTRSQAFCNQNTIVI